MHASAESLKLITFDADGTLYADGAHLEHDNEMIALIISLMRSNIHVAIVTAAGYPGAFSTLMQLCGCSAHCYSNGSIVIIILSTSHW